MNNFTSDLCEKNVCKQFSFSVLQQYSLFLPDSGRSCVCCVCSVPLRSHSVVSHLPLPAPLSAVVMRSSRRYLVLSRCLVARALCSTWTLQTLFVTSRAKFSQGRRLSSLEPAGLCVCSLLGPPPVQQQVDPPRPSSADPDYTTQAESHNNYVILL